MDLTLSFDDLSLTPITLENGIVLNYLRAGEGPTVILIHGAMGDWRSWSPQWDFFAKNFDCIAYSRRYSYPNPNPMNSLEHNALVDAEDLEGLMDALDIEKAILVGSSYGGFTALAMAVRAPWRVGAVVSVEAPMMRYAKTTQEGSAVADAFLAASAEPARKAFERGNDEAGVKILTGGIVGKSPDEIPAPILERRMQNAKAAKSLALSRDEFPLLEQEKLAQLPMPVLILSGENTAPVHDAIFKAVALAMPNAVAKKIEGSGHSVSQQQPERFNAEVMAFLKDAMAATSTFPS